MDLDWKWVCFFLCIHAVSAIWPFGKPKGCVLDVNRDVSYDNPPVLLRRNARGYDLATADDIISARRLFGGHHRTGVIRIPRHEEIYVACPGPGNSLYGLRQPAQFATFVCQFRHNILRMDNTLIVPHQLKCLQPVTTVIRETGKLCAHGQAKEYEIGYSITPESNPSASNPEQYGWLWMKMHVPSPRAVQEGNTSFYHLLTCCYDSAKVRTFYSINTLEGDKIAGTETKGPRPPYILGQSSLYPPGFDVDNAYFYPQQKNAISQLLGPVKSDLLLNRTFLVRGHLASDEDFLMTTWQASAHVYLNLAPQWQSINRGHWYSLEQKLRRLADLMQSSFVIATGTYGVMTTLEDHNSPQELYLDPERQLLPVPKLLWKVVFAPKNGSCIAFVMSNNPIEEEPSPPICNDICKEHGWPADYQDAHEGRMYCCTADQLRSVVEYVPEFRCSNVLDDIPEEAPKPGIFHSLFRSRKSL